MSKNIFDISMPHRNLDMRHTKVGLTPRVLLGMQTAFFFSTCTTNFSEKKGMLVVYLGI